MSLQAELCLYGGVSRNVPITVLGKIAFFSAHQMHEQP